jgi:hypothetical protein
MKLVMRCEVEYRNLLPPTHKQRRRHKKREAILAGAAGIKVGVRLQTEHRHGHAIRRYSMAYGDDETILVL